jgi:protein-disulfide isomerase/uncharacterized membrane protein
MSTSPALSPRVPRRLTALAALALVGFGLSVYLTQHFHDVRGGASGFRSFCNMGENMNCDVVAASRYAEVFLGIPLSDVAAGWYLALFIVALLGRDPFWRRDSLRAALVLTGVAFVTSAVYLAVMLGVLRTFCLFCLGVDAVNALALVLVLSLKPEGLREHKPDPEKVKVLAGVTGGGLLTGVVLLGLIYAGPVDSKILREAAQEVLATPLMPVGSGPELPSLGDPKAPVTIVEFSDFQCPHCRNGAMILNTVLNRYPGKVRVVLRNHPFDPACNRKMERGGHAGSCEAARAAWCAHQQGRFAALYEALFENQSSLAPGVPAKLAKDAGLDADKLQGCMASPEAAAAVARDLEEGERLGVKATPTFFINGHRVEGAYPVPVWNQLVDELAR